MTPTPTISALAACLPAATPAIAQDMQTLFALSDLHWTAIYDDFFNGPSSATASRAGWSSATPKTRMRSVSSSATIKPSPDRRSRAT